MNCKACSDLATGGIDVHVDGFGGVLGLEEKELGHDDVGGIVVYGSVDANNPLLKQARENVVGPLPARRVLNHHGYHAVVAAIQASSSSGEESSGT